MESDDPLSIFMAPPANETAEERAQRLTLEKLQRQRNAEIEEMLRVDRANMKHNQVRVLLVGQSESGKSTVLKNFQLAYSPRAFHAERATWTRIIFLNIIRAINVICSSLTSQLQLTADDTTPPNSPLASPVASPAQHESSMPTFELTDEHRNLINRLRDFHDLEIRLQESLSEPVDTTPASSSSSGFEGRFGNPAGNNGQEFFVRSGTSWKMSWNLRRSSRDTQRSSQDEERQRITLNQEIMGKLLSSRGDIMRLWGNPVVRRCLGRTRTKLEDSASYYLDNLSRIITPDYEPSDEDVVRARLRTVGVQTYPIKHERELSREVANEWVLYDVGGSRSQRAAWVPFFQHMNAIIFLAPINCFNEKLAEDHKVNRLEDSFALYKQVVSSALLKTVQVILFLNKTDLLAENLRNGVVVKKHVTSYGDRPNEFTSVSKYFRKKFKDICQNFSPEPRPFYSYLTSAVDIAATSVTLSVVRDGILRSNLESADML